VPLAAAGALGAVTPPLALVTRSLDRRDVENMGAVAAGSAFASVYVGART